MLIVDDAPGELPPYVVNMPERIIAISHMDLVTLSSIQKTFNDDLLEIKGDVPEIMTVNGQTQPVMQIEANIWYRWRILFQSVSSFYNFELDHPSCKMELLAKVRFLLKW